MSTAYAPGYPHPTPGLSFWLQGTRNSSLIGHRTTKDLPDSAEVAIIGAGISGAATAYFLLTGPNPPKSVVILEAREVCDGATGRNGGHCRPSPYASYSEYKQSFGVEQALKILENENDTLALVTEIIEKEGIDCDFWNGTSFDIAMDKESADTLTASYHEMKADGGNMDAITWIPTPEEAEKKTRLSAAQLAAEFPAATLWPYKLVAHIIKLCITQHGLNVQTQTPVRSVEPAGPNGGWRLKTDRGNLTASKVVYTTNAFTATLLPEFVGRIYPFRGQCSAIVPTKAFTGENMLTKSFGAFYATKGRMNYAMQRPNDGILIVGGSAWKTPRETLLGQTNDGETIPSITEDLKGCMKNYMAEWGEPALGEGMLCDWTGIMGYTPHDVPYVGAVHGKPGAFISAGHAGHGMAKTFTCSRGLAALIRGESWESTKLPECFQPTPKRLEKSI